MKRLICFAVSQEKRFFNAPSDTRILVTGMGPQAAEKSLSEDLATHRPEFIVSAGFAGGLNPDLKSGQVILDDRDDVTKDLAPKLMESSRVLKGHIQSASRVLITQEEKSIMHQSTHADAVDMETDCLRIQAQQFGIPFFALRVISDTATEDLPLDFNRFMTSQGSMQFGGLMFHLITHPLTIPPLIRFQSKVKIAARQLGYVLSLI